MSGFLKRVYVIYVFLILLTIGIIWRVVYLQFFADIKISDIDISYRQEQIEANRGSILAMDGRALSTSVPYFQIRMDCILPSEKLFNDNIDALSKQLSQFFQDKSAAAYKREIVTARREGRRYKALGNRLVDYSEMLQIKQFPIFKEGVNRGGIITEQRNRRINPYGRLAYRTIGFINNEGTGTGLEKSYESYLRGSAGSQTVRRMLGGEWVPAKSDDIIHPSDGLDVQTTLNIEIQEATENALRQQLSKSNVFEGATAIVMEVKSGAIRAIANMKKGRDGSFDESYNYAIGHATEPGSTFKLATLVALMEDGYATLNTKVETGNGRWRYSTTTFSDVHHSGFGDITLLEAFEKSSNVAFAKLVVEYYSNREKSYVDRLVNMKLNERFNLDLPGEARAQLYTPGDQSWNRLSLPMMSIGYFSLLTPLHTLTFYNAIANNGKMMKPYFVENLQKDGVVIKKFGPQVISGSICSKKTVQQVQDALRKVVERGTAKSIDNPKYQISGKTGTAQIAFDGVYKDSQGNRKHQASFAGFFPSDNPEYSVIVVLYTNKTKENFYGGAWAAPVFREIADKIYTNSPHWFQPVSPGNTPLDMNIQSLAQASVPQYDGIVPDVCGMGLKDALYILENLGYRVSFAGRGRVVAQNPPHETPLLKNGIINLQLSDKYEVK